MDERWANIDLAFRNGLKDYEVLPPAEAWDNIHPRVQNKPWYFNVMRTAALIAVLSTLSFSAYWLSLEMTSDPVTGISAFDIEKSSPYRLPEVALTPRENAEIQAIPYNEITSVISDNTDNSVMVPETTMDVRSNLGDFGLNTASVEPRGGFQQTTAPQINFELKSPVDEYYPETKPVLSERWSIAAMASPTYYSSFASGNNNIAKSLQNSENAILSYSGGLSVSYKINRKLSIQAGLYYSSMGQQVNGVNSYAGFEDFFNTKGDHAFEVLTSSGSIVTNNVDVFLQSAGPVPRVITAYNNDVFDPAKSNLAYINNSVIQNFGYLEVPVFLRYKFIDRSLDLNLIGGVSYDLLVSNNVYAKTVSGKYPVGETMGLNPLTLSSSIGMGMEYSFSRKLSLNLEPTFRYYLNPFNENGPRVHPYSFGIFSGFSYRF